MSQVGRVGRLSQVLRIGHNVGQVEAGPIDRRSRFHQFGAARHPYPPDQTISE